MEKVANRNDIYGGITPDFSRYVENRLSPEQVKRSTTLIVDNLEMKREAMNLLQECLQYYNNLDGFRRKRIRNRNLYVGEHYNDLVDDPDSGETMTKGDYIRKQGMVPKKNNQIRQVLKNLEGQYRDNDTMSTVIAVNREDQMAGEMMTKTLQNALKLNHATELDVTQFREFLISGMFGWKTMYKYISERNNSDVFVSSPHPHRVFFNTGITDIRLYEIHTIGEILDVRIEDLLSAFAKNKADAQQIRDWYGMSEESTLGHYAYNGTLRSQDSDVIDQIDFSNTLENGLCRVYEIWKKVNQLMIIVHDHLNGKDYEWLGDEEDLEYVNQQRIQEFGSQGVALENIPLLEWEERYEDRWHFWFLTINGDILQHGVTPYDHEQTPYTLGIYPLVDGNIFGLVSDIEDQQNAINDNMTLLNFIISASAKGLLMIPEDVIPKGWTPNDFADQWSKSNGVVVYKPSPTGQVPQQIAANSTNVGAMEMLQLQMGLLEKISGVTGAIQGHTPTAGTPSSRYAQEANNATLANRDFFDFFYWRRRERDHKVVRLIQQYYEDDRNIAINGRDFNPEITKYIKEIGQNIEYTMAIGQTKTSQAYRQVMDEFLFNLLQSQQIDIDTFLENTSMPFADKLRDSINKRRQELEMAQQQMMQQGGQMDPRAQQLIQQMTQGPQIQSPSMRVLA